jgi:3D-(3,5/4)-trihydroxycyclohexane-1,2-dione acylhydrolase (decyclizing)
VKTIRLTAAQAMVRYLSNQMNGDGERYIAGVWAIFGHGNVAGLGEALQAAGDDLPTWRGQNEQSMAHAAVAYAKASNRDRAMMVTSSIGPGATNLVTAAALAHVNRLRCCWCLRMCSPAARLIRCCSSLRIFRTARSV